jgi:hypothetical protein
MKRVLLALVLLSATAACGGSADAVKQAGASDPEFLTKGGTAACMAHQKVKPGKSYSETGDTGAKLQMLHYYTVNGALPYCDGKAPTAVDKAWANLYVQLGADPAKVAKITG